METLETIKIAHPGSDIGYRYVNATDLTPDMVIYAEGVQEEGIELPPVAPVTKKKSAAKG